VNGIQTRKLFGLNQEIRSFISAMKTRRQVENEKVQREIFTLFNKSDILHLNGAKVLSMVEYNGMLKIYSSCNEEGWRPSKEMLVSNVLILSKQKANGLKEQIYPVPKWISAGDIRRRRERNREKSRAKRKPKVGDQSPVSETEKA
jgi:hypothetical protein